MPRPYILISNDDGVDAEGITFLANTLTEVADVLVVAPDGARSGAACSISGRTPLLQRLVYQNEGLEVFSCSGTPVDCIKLALNTLCRRRPDLVCGGINHGDNSSVNAHYSGTVGITTEAALQGFPAIAFSHCGEGRHLDFSATEPYILRIVQHVLDHGLPPFTHLNVNFPDLPEFQGLQVCRMGHTRWVNEIETCRHPRGYKYHWLVGERVCLDPAARDTDDYALSQGYVAVTPISLDYTAYNMLSSLTEALQ